MLLLRLSLFLAVGFCIKYIGQDLRNCRGVDYRMPVVGACIDFCTIILSGAPFLRGFFAKDYFLEGALRGEGCFIGGIINIISVNLTGLYCGRLIEDFVGYCPTTSSCFNSSIKGCLCFPLLLYPGIYLGTIFESRESGLAVVGWLESILLGGLRAMLFIRASRLSYPYIPKSHGTFFVNIYLGVYLAGFASRNSTYQITKNMGTWGEIG